MNGFRRSAMFGGSGFGSRSFLSGPSLSQTAPTDWQSRGRSAITQWDALVARVSNIVDDAARGQLLEWMGRSDVPGSNTERYNAVLQDLREGEAADPALAERRVGQLEGAVEELSAFVGNAEEKYGTITGFPKKAPALDEKTLLVGGAALILLLVIPLMIKD